MLNKLKLKNRMLIGYAAPIAIYLIFSSIVYVSLKQVSQTFKEVKRVEQVIGAANEMALSMEGMIKATRGYLVNGDSNFEKRYEIEKQQFQQSIDEVKPLVVRSDQQERLQQIAELMQEYDTFSQQIRGLKKQNQQAKMLTAFSQGTGVRLADKMHQIYEDFSRVEQDLLNQKTTDTEADLQAVLTALILGSLLMIILAVTIALIISSGITKMIQQATQAIANSSAEIVATVEQHERTAIEQSASVNQTTTTMGELNASSQQSAEQAEVVAQKTKRVLSLVSQATTADALASAASLRGKVGQIAEQILCLSQQTNQIGTISTLVSDLANQTNMLALNAAVEAVRVGEHGKGFSVVAAEIRKLADQSKKSAEHIKALVAEIQRATNSTVMVTDEGTKMVDAIATEVNDIALSNQQIFLTAKQQAMAVQQVLEAMNVINQGTVQTASGISQTRIGTQKLNEAASHLQSVL